MKDQHDKQTPDMITKRGRPPKGASAMSQSERKAAERDRKKKEGFKLMWLSPAEQEVIEKLRSESS